MNVEYQYVSYKRSLRFRWSLDRRHATEPWISAWTQQVSRQVLWALMKDRIPGWQAIGR